MKHKLWSNTQRVGSYQSLEGLDGSHYGGLHFRLAREFMTNQPGFPAQMLTSDGSTDLDHIHGGNQKWLALRGNHDGDLKQSTVVFFAEPHPTCGGPHWFLRDTLPLAACTFLGRKPLDWHVDTSLLLNCYILIADGHLSNDEIEARDP